MSAFQSARELLRRFKSDSYVNGFGVLPQAGPIAAQFGKRAALVQDGFPGSDALVKTIADSLAAASVELAGLVPGAAPNAPLEDLARIHGELVRVAPDVIVSFGGGSTIDCTKAAEVLRTLGGSIEEYFGVGLVTAKLQKTGRALTPHVAIQTAASSSAHLTKYSNITDVRRGQKKLIVDNAIVPARAVFDFSVTTGAPPALTADGALDGVSHCLEVLYGAVGKPYYAEMREVARTGIGLVLKYLPAALASPQDIEARQALGLATDLGGYAIMLGGTNGAHLTSFSLIDILSHGRACAIMNPYYTVFFAPAIQEPLKLVAALCVENGCAPASITALQGRELGIAVARALMSFLRKAGVPPTLGEVPGFSGAHIDRALAAAKDPQLRMKLENMPVPMTADMVDGYMGPILQAARTGVLDGIRNVPAGTAPVQ